MSYERIPNRKAIDIREGRALPELLAPAGSYRALQAAIDGGADAIYMGGAAFNARINAKNFTPDELRRGISLAHEYGAKVYITANTLIYDRELDDFLRACEDAYLCGADALIVADVGAASEIKKRIPIELHASTQVSGHGAYASRILADAGFSRMVCAREMCAEDIRAFIDNSPLEAEVFVHGALCVCHSGQCLFSSLVGGRSGNRGECAQPCRLPYKGVSGKEQYALSLKDLSLAMHVPNLIEMGVCSLKIEGRMKSPEYVREVTRIWRALLDQRRAATYEDMRQLDAVFSRSGFTDGYFVKKIGRSMLGVRSEEQKKESRALSTFERIERKIPIDMKMTVREGIPVTLTITRRDNLKSVSVSGNVPEAARTAPIDKDTVRRSLLKLGDTPYVAQNVDIELDEGLMLPISSLNALRRSAVEALCERAEQRVTNTAQKSKPKSKRTVTRVAMFYEPESIPESAYGYFDVIYTPLEKYTGSTNGVALPPVIFDSEREAVRRMLADAKEKGAQHVLVGNLGHLDLVENSGLCVHGDLRLNVTNASTASRIEEMGIEDVILSPELGAAQMRDIGGKTYAFVYGRAPLMVTEKCVGKECGGCVACEDGKTCLTDRKGIKFPVRRTFEHRSIIFNSVPFYMADKADVLRSNGLSMQFFVFSVESKKEAAEIIEAYKKKTPPKNPTAVKRIK
ncbi:MAG: U32 family peptidase [Ruminococcaceae bacterium]|nr:U32 family peptidase [Oscillospiraceae bacterium]